MSLEVGERYGLLRFVIQAKIYVKRMADEKWLFWMRSIKQLAGILMVKILTRAAGNRNI